MAKKELTYRQAYDELAEIVANIEKGEVDVDVLGDMVERANFLLKHCETKLLKVEEKVKGSIESKES